MADEASSSRGPFLFPPTPQSIQTLLDTDSADPDRARTILRHALSFAVTHADVDLTTWLTAVQGELASMLDEAVNDLEDDDGWGVVGMAIQSSCGQAEREEVVRLVVGRWGVNAGPRNGRDRAGWTPLHLAAIVSTPQIVSVLMNRGASALALTAQGLSPYDLITGMEGREALAILLDPLADQPPDDAHIEPQRRELLKRRRIRLATQAAQAAKRGELKRIALERERWVRDRAKHIGVESSVLFNSEESRDGEDEEERDTDSEETDDDLSKPNHLVFHINQVPALLDVFVTGYRPVCQPLSRRALPANALYLYARFAHYQCDESWLEELLEGAVDAIEQGVYGNGEDLAYLAFWEYNLTLLLFLLRGDQSLAEVCDDLNFLTMIEELINAIHVFIIRIAERKIDEIMDAAMLDFEALEDFDDVRFTDEWNLFRSFGKKKTARDPHVAQAIFSLPNTPERPVDRAKRDSAKLHRRVNSIQDLRATASAATAEAKEAIANGMSKAQAVFGDKPSPRKVTDILTSVLLILQLYEVNPAFIVQVFSQTFFWISSELFNRIITRKKYLCRTKAVQIRMNITALEDWTRSNGLPPNIASKHLEPVMQLLTWLQCSSQITEFDTLIGTVQTLRALNPLQMRRAVQNYRFEVNETHMADDCVQYLAQLQRDWDRRRVQIGSQANRLSTEGSMPIEALFDGSTAIGDWTPQTAPESPGELLDSRFMLPFLIPPNEYLLATPPPETAYRNLLMERPPLPDGSIPSRPLSSASYSSSQPLGWVQNTHSKIRDLPPDFFSWLKVRQAEAQSRLGFTRPRTDSRLREEPEQMAVEIGDDDDDEVEILLGETPSRGDTLRALEPLTEDREVTPTRLKGEAPPLPPKDRQPFPALFAPPPLKSPSATSISSFNPPSSFNSPTLNSPASFESPSRDSQRHARQASAELAYKHSPTSAGGDILAENIELIARANDSMKANGNGGHYELGRVRRERQASVSSMNSVASGGSSKSGKKWWQLRKSSGSTISAEDGGRRTREGTAETIRPGSRGVSVSPVKAAKVEDPFRA